MIKKTFSKISIRDVIVSGDVDTDLSLLISRQQGDLLRVKEAVVVVAKEWVVANEWENVCHDNVGLSFVGMVFEVCHVCSFAGKV